MSSRNRPKQLVALDWDAHTFRVVHAFLGKRGLKIDKLLTVGIPADVDPTNPEDMGRHIRRTLDHEGINARYAVVDVPRDQAILKTLTLPTSQTGDLPGMVQIQIAKELPFPVAEAVIDFAVVAEADDAPTGDVLVGAIRQQLLAQYRATFASAGLRLERVGLRPYATKVAVEALLRPAMPARVLFIDVRPTFMEIDVLRDGALVFSRSASVTIPTDQDDPPVLSIEGAEPGDVAAPGQGEEPTPKRREATEDAGGRDRTIQSLVLEVTRSIEAYRAADPGAAIDHVVIGGDVGVEEDLAEAIHQRLRLTTQLYNPASTFGWEPDEGAAASAFAASLGLALGHAEDGSLRFNFLHPKETVSVAKERLRKAPLVAAVVVLFLAACGVGLAQVSKPGRQQLARIEARIRELESEKKDNKKLVALVDQIVAFDEQQHVWVDVLYEVMSLLPSNQELVLNHVEMNQKEGRLTLKTRTVRRETATQIIRKLRAFRREGRKGPRFDGRIGPQTEKKGEKYPYHQDLRITVLRDEPRKTSSAKNAERGATAGRTASGK